MDRDAYGVPSPVALSELRQIGITHLSQMIVNAFFKERFISRLPDLGIGSQRVAWRKLTGE